METTTNDTKVNAGSTMMLLKWKHWYWYCALLSNILSALCIVLQIIFLAKQITTASDINSLSFLCVSGPLLMTLLLIYVIKTSKESRICNALIKKSRLKYFSWGLISSFVMFNAYVVCWLISYKTNSTVPLYIALPMIIIFGFASTTCLTIYEFCIAFDVYYSRNKVEIIKDFFNTTVSMETKVKPNKEKRKKFFRK